MRLYNPQPTTTVHPESSFLGKRDDKAAAAATGTGAVPEGRLIQTYAAHGYEVLSLAVAGDNARFVSAGGDRAVFLWDVATAQTLRRFSNGGHSSRVNSVTFAGDGDALVVSGGFDTTVRVWDTRSGGGKPVQVLAEARDAVTAVAARGPELLAGSVDGRLRSYDVRAGKLVTDVVGPSVTSLCLARDGRSVLVGALDSSIRLMDRDSGACLRSYAAPARWRNEELRVQSVLGGKERFVVAGDEMTAAVDEPAHPPSSSRPAASATTATNNPTDGKVWAWDLMTGQLVATVPVPWGPADDAAARRKVVGRDGREKERKNVVSCLAWRDSGFGDQFCAGGTSGVVTVFGS